MFGVAPSSGEETDALWSCVWWTVTLLLPHSPSLTPLCLYFPSTHTCFLVPRRCSHYFPAHGVLMLSCLTQNHWWKTLDNPYNTKTESILCCCFWGGGGGGGGVQLSWKDRRTFRRLFHLCFTINREWCMMVKLTFRISLWKDFHIIWNF